MPERRDKCVDLVYMWQDGHTVFSNVCSSAWPLPWCACGSACVLLLAGHRKAGLGQGNFKLTMQGRSYIHWNATVNPAESCNVSLTTSKLVSMPLECMEHGQKMAYGQRMPSDSTARLCLLLHPLQSERPIHSSLIRHLPDFQSLPLGKLFGSCGVCPNRHP